MKWHCSPTEDPPGVPTWDQREVVEVHNVANIEKEFREYIEKLTTQPVELLLWDTDKLFAAGKGERPEVDMDHRFWARFPTAFWAMRIIIESFLDAYAKLDFYADFQIAANERVQQRLSKQLIALMPGVQSDVITALSAERYESEEAAALNLLLLPPGVPQDLGELQQNVAFFQTDQRLELVHRNVHALRKQLNMARDGCLVMGYDSSGLVRSLGVGRGALLKRYPHLAFRGHMTWSYCVPPKHRAGDNGCRLRYCGGRLMLPLLDLSQAENARMIQATGGSCPENVIGQVLALAKGQKKGTIIVLTHERLAKYEAERLCGDHHQGILLEEPRSLLKRKCKWQRVIQQLTAIDGALLVDFKGDCLACGVILDGEAVGKGDMARGARYNSALNYARICRKFLPDHPMAIVVASEDGMLNILSNRD